MTILVSKSWRLNKVLKFIEIAQDLRNQGWRDRTLLA